MKSRRQALIPGALLAGAVVVLTPGAAGAQEIPLDIGVNAKTPLLDLGVDVEADVSTESSAKVSPKIQAKAIGLNISAKVPIDILIF